MHDPGTGSREEIAAGEGRVMAGGGKGREIGTTVVA